MFDTMQVRFDVPGTPEDAAKSLAEATPRSAFQTITTESIVGAVSVDRVTLYRYRPLLSNSFAPVFRGKFTFDSGQTRLEGKIRLHLFVRAFMVLWFGFLGLIASLLALSEAAKTAQTGQHWGLAALAGVSMASPVLFMILFGYGLLSVGRRLARKDPQKIDDHVRRALGLSAA